MILLVSLLFPGPVAGADLANTEVTYQNLYELEQYWPYHVRLTDKSWKPEGFEGDRFSYGLGVLVRVEQSGMLRVDFARFGRHLVPARVTDVVESANEIRLGKATKMGANFVLAVAPRLLDPGSETLKPVRGDAFAKVRAYLVVAADPSSESFPAIASSLESIRSREGVMPVLFPQGGHKDGAVWKLCKKAGWSDPFLFDRFTTPYTESFLGEHPQLPSVMLTSPEGRVMLSSPWSEASPAALGTALDRELGPTDSNHSA
jgi:hypothetical protein